MATHRPRRAALALSLACGLALWSPPAQACSICGCGDPLLTSTDPAAMVGRLRLQVDTEYLRVDAGTDGVPGSTDQLTQWSTRLNVAWRPLDDLSLVATLPYVSKVIRTVEGGDRLTASALSGLGDVEVGARWTAWRSVQVGARRAQELAVSAGTMAPTGQKQAREGGALIDPHGQLGTGGWGPFAGLHYRFEEGPWSAFASLSYRVRTEARYFDATRYEFGDALLWSVHGQWLATRRLALDLGVDGRRAAADRATSETGEVEDPVVNTGGTVLAVAPAAYLNATGGLWLFVRGQLPVLKRLEGEQDVKPTVTVGLQVQLL